MPIDLSRPLRRNRLDALVGGVCAGIGDYLSWDHTVVRVIAILGTLLTGLWPGIIAYLVLWLIIPPAGVGARSEQVPPPPSTPPESDETSRP